jgi:hypothetical protein
MAAARNEHTTTVDRERRQVFGRRPGECDKYLTNNNNLAKIHSKCS